MVGWRREENKKFINLHTARATLLSLNSSKKLFHLSSCGCKLKGILTLTTSERGWLSKLWSKTLPFSLSWVRVLHKLVWVGWRELNTHTHTLWSVDEIPLSKIDSLENVRQFCSTHLGVRSMSYCCTTEHYWDWLKLMCDLNFKSFDLCNEVYPKKKQGSECRSNKMH